MNILFLAPRIPYPLDTGAKIRSYSLLKSLVERHQVTLLTFYANHEELSSLKNINGLHVVGLPNRSINTLNVFQVAQGLISRLPITSVKYKKNAYGKTLKQLMRSRKFDLVHCESIHLAHYLFRYDFVPRILNAHNIEHKLANQMQEVEKSALKRFVLKLQARRMQWLELETAQRFEMILTVSENDKREYLHLNGNCRVETIENGVDIGYFSTNSESSDKHIVFSGSMDWQPNVDGVLFFVKNIYPIIKKSCPDVGFTVVGRSPGAELLKLPIMDSSIVVTGTVDDVRPFIERAAVYVVPLRIGGGTRLKVLEAFAMKKAVVSTGLGCEGIECSDSKHLLIRDDPVSFADAVIELLETPGTRASLGCNARNLVVENYSWDSIGNRLNDIYSDLIKRP